MKQKPKILKDLSELGKVISFNQQEVKSDGYTFKYCQGAFDEIEGNKPTDYTQEEVDNIYKEAKARVERWNLK